MDLAHERGDVLLGFEAGLIGRAVECALELAQGAEPRAPHRHRAIAEVVEQQLVAGFE